MTREDGVESVRPNTDPLDTEALETALSRTLALQSVRLDVSPGATLRAAPIEPQAEERPLLPRREARFASVELGLTVQVAETGAVLDLRDQLRDVGEDVSLGETLGQGGMGVVRLARQHALDREVAVKSLLPTHRSTGSVEAMMREALLAGGLEHPNILPIHTLCWSEEEGPVIVMKRIEGESWADLLAREGASRTRALARHLEVLRDVCNAVEFAHSKGVIHRDIKPDNVMVGQFGEVYLLDWGIALRLEATTKTSGGRIIGTPHYMAPEMVEDGARLDERTDIFLLGAVLHEVVTGQHRHQGRGVLGVLVRVSAADPYDYDESVPEELATICNKACHPDPAERYQSVGSFRQALERFEQHRHSVEAARLGYSHLKALEVAVEARDDEGGLEARLALNRLYSTSRTSFEQALRDWPENVSAQEGLVRCIEVMVGSALEGGSVESAEVLLAELEAPPTHLVERLEALKAERKSAEAASEQLDAFRSSMRLQGADWGRSILTVANGVGTAIVLMVANALIATAYPEPTIGQQLVFLGIGAALNVASITVFRRFVLDSRIYVRLMTVLLFLAPTLMLNRLAVLLVGMEPSLVQLVAMDCVVMVAFCLVVGVTLTRTFLVSAVIALVTAPLALLWPTWMFEIISVGFIVHSLLLAWALRPGKETLGDLAAPAGGPPPGQAPTRARQALPKPPSPPASRT